MSRRLRREALLSGASIPVLVRTAHRGARVARYGEALLLAAGGVGITLAASELSGGGVERPESWAIAILVGALVATSWLVETFETPPETASALDKRLGFSGALLTAYEAQSSGESSSVVKLLAAKVAAQLSPAQALRAARPLSPFPIVAPFLAAALLALCIEATRPALHPLRLQELASAMVSKLAEARGLSLETLESGRDEELGQAPTEVPGELTELLSQARELELKWKEESPDPAAALDTLEAFERQLESLALDLPVSSPVEDRIRDLSTLMDAGAMRARDASDNSKATDGSLASGRANGKIERSHSRRDVESAPRHNPNNSQSLSRERGADVASRWRPEYDEIVALWVESRRTVNDSDQ